MSFPVYCLLHFFLPSSWHALSCRGTVVNHFWIHLPVGVKTNYNRMIGWTLAVVKTGVYPANMLRLILKLERNPPWTLNIVTTYHTCLFARESDIFLLFLFFYQCGVGGQQTFISRKKSSESPDERVYNIDIEPACRNSQMYQAQSCIVMLMM